MDWLTTNTYHHSAFGDAAKLAAIKREKGLRLAVCLPTWNEENTIGSIVTLLREALIEEVPLIDSLVVVDSGSLDSTCEVARKAGAEVFDSASILPEFGFRRGKGENLWKSLYAVDADLFCFIDADIRNMDARFVCGLVGPLLESDELGYVKAFYHRPGVETEQGIPTGGGRVTEILVRPLFSLFAPELCPVIQPLAGEYAARRRVLEQLAFPVGYGVEVAHLLDLQKKFGLSILAQCDLEERVHRHRSNADLGKAAFGILQTFFSRVGTPDLRQLLVEHSMRFRLVVSEKGVRRLEETEIHEEERPPMREVPAYCLRKGCK